MKRNIIFKDAAGHICRINLELKQKEKGLTFSACGDIEGQGGGQCQDSISPATEAQGELVALWNKYHLNSMSAGTPKQTKCLKSCPSGYDSWKWLDYHTPDGQPLTAIDAVIIQSERDAIEKENKTRIASLEKILTALNVAKRARVHYLNKWVSLPTFSDTILKNVETKENGQSAKFYETVFKLIEDIKLISNILDGLKAGNDLAIQGARLKSLLWDMHEGRPHRYGSAWLFSLLPENFEQTIEDLCARIEAENTVSDLDKMEPADRLLKITGTEFIVGQSEYKKHFHTDTEKRHVFPITLKQGEVEWTFNFGQSINGGSTNPTPYDVLAGLTDYDPEDFDNFCMTFGYDQDSRTAEKIYKAVCEEWEQVQRFFQGEQLDLLREIQ